MEELSREVLKKIDELVVIIHDSKEYKNYLSIKKQLEENVQINQLIKEIKQEQQYVVKNNLNNQEEDRKLQEKIKKLKSIPLYNEYLNAIDELNAYLEPIKNIQDYFDFLTE